MKIAHLLPVPLNMPILSRVRRNHALEHATMHVLSERVAKAVLVGRSSVWGFRIYGEVPTEDVVASSREGLRRLKAGHREMAVHPNCGSNIALAGTFAALGAFVALSGKHKDGKHRLARLPVAMTAATLGIFLAQLLGPLFQAYITTQPAVGDMRIISVLRERRAGILVHSIRTEA